MVPHRDGRKTSLKGDTFITSLIFLFVLIGTLRLCCMKTMHEAKLAAIFVQETQGVYLLENLMALARDYVYQIVQNPKEPHLFLGPNAFRTQDKLNCEEGAYVIDFNGSLSKEQIVPEDFPLKIQDEGWEIKGGPIFWQDNKKNSSDERYLSEVFMLGTLKLDSKLIPDWTIHTVQTMEIEKNPLCDFQLYAEGDTTLTTNIGESDDWNTTIEGPVQINGNARFSHSNGSKSNEITFKNKFNCAGYALRLTGTSLENYKLPEKYHMYDNSTNSKKASDKKGTTWNTYFFNGNQLTQWHNTSITESKDTISTTETEASGISYERNMFQEFEGKFNTRFRIYRPMGFDPSGYWGFWTPGSFAVDDGIDKEEQVLNFCFGFHNLAQNSSQYAPGLYKNPNSEILAAAKKLQGLNTYQMTEKLRLVEMQKPTNFPGVHIYIKQKQKNEKESSNPLSVPNNFVFSTYIDDAFPPSKDNVFLNRYLNLAFQDNSVIDDSSYIGYSFNKQQNESYHFALDALPRYIHSLSMYMNISKNKYACHGVGKDEGKDGYINNNSYNIVKIKSEFSPQKHDDDSCPPHKITENSSVWTLNGNYMTRITGEHYNFLYDRNRAKWIQIVDIDVQQLTTWLNNNKSVYGDSILPIVTINSEGTIYPNKNYKYKVNNNDEDIRINYSKNRKDFFSNNRYKSYKDTTSVIDIGIRLINAETLPNKGMTFCCPYPLYIKGNFNTTTPKPALIVADSITILPSDWQDWRSQMDPINSPLWYGLQDSDSTKKRYLAHPYTKGPTIYADIITGRTHPHYWIQYPDTTEKTDKEQTQAPNPDNGIHDAFRSLCDFNTKIEFYGSLILPYFCQEQWEPPINFCKITTVDPKNYAYPPLNMHLWTRSSIPAGMPFYHRINRGRKTHSIGDVAYGVLSGETLYKKDWVLQGEKVTIEEIEANALSLPDYHEALPNYLKYETTPE